MKETETNTRESAIDHLNADDLPVVFQKKASTGGSEKWFYHLRHVCEKTVKYLPNKPKKGSGSVF